MGYKALRASINRNMRVIASDTTVRSRTLQHHDKPVIVEKSAYKETLHHIRANTKLASRVNVALGFEGDRMSKRAKEIIERYELYCLHARHTKGTPYKIGEYLRQYTRKDATVTHGIRLEVSLWYKLHGMERIQRMRKQHAVVGTDKRTILRTA